MNNKYIGLKYMDKEGDFLQVVGYDKKENKYLIKYADQLQNQFYSYALTENEINEELKQQDIRIKFHSSHVILL